MSSSLSRIVRWRVPLGGEYGDLGVVRRILALQLQFDDPGRKLDDELPLLSQLAGTLSEIVLSPKE